MDVEYSSTGFCIRASRGGGTVTKCGRWNPTSEQVKVLTELFRSGLRTPSTDQIQNISSQLSFYGKIESKNVFYWFQNHKARERHKRRRVFVDVDQIIIDHSTAPPQLSSTKPHFSRDVPQPAGRVIETLQLFPLNSLNEADSNKLRIFTDNLKESGSFTHDFGTREMNHPALDLRLSFV